MLSLHHNKKLCHLGITAALSFGASPSFNVRNKCITPPLSADQPSTSFRSKDELLSNYTAPPPVSPWPKKLHPNHLVSIINRQPTLDLAFQAFEYAGKFHPGFIHTHQTYSALITRLARGRHFQRAETLLSQMQSSGVKCHGEGIFITLIRNYGLANRSKDSFQIFLRMVDFGVHRSIRSLNCLLSVLVMNKEFDWVYLLFKSYKKKFGLMPNVITCNILVKVLCRKGDLSAALDLLDEMPALGLVPNLVTYTTLLVGYVECGDLERAKRLFQDILDKGLMPDVMTYTVMIDGYCKKGWLVDAVKIMDEMEETGVRPNHVTYSVMIEAYCKERKYGEAGNLLVDMLNHNHVPSSTLCCKVIDVLCQEEKVDGACILWKKLLNKSVAPDNAVTCTLIHWLCKKGKVLEAKKLFNDLEKDYAPNLLTYNVLIAGMCEAGELFEAATLHDDMVEKKCIPDSFAYQMLIKGFCDANNPKEGIRLFEEMVAKGCLLNESIYSILIDRLSFSGLEAELNSLLSVIANMGGRIDSKSWEVILTRLADDLDVTSMLDCIILDDVA